MGRLNVMIILSSEMVAGCLGTPESRPTPKIFGVRGGSPTPAWVPTPEPRLFGSLITQAKSGVSAGVC